MDVNENITAKGFLASLIKERDEHRQALAELEPLIAAVEKRIGVRPESYTISSVVSTNGDTPKPQPETVRQELSDLNLAGLSRKKAAPVVVRAANRWLTAREIVEYMGKGGINTTAKTALLSIYPVLNEHSELQSVTGKGGMKLYGLKEWEVPENFKGKRPRPRSTSGRITMGDAAEEVLKKTHRLHADKLVKAIQDMGVDTTKKNMVDGFRRDSKRRFKNLGRNMWTLA
jgi:hypothetical protein